MCAQQKIQPNIKQTSTKQPLGGCSIIAERSEGGKGNGHPHTCTSPAYSLSTGTSQAAKPNKNARHTKILKINLLTGNKINEGIRGIRIFI
jgi:hypothetical protein